MTKRTYGYWQFSMRAWYGTLLLLFLKLLSSFPSALLTLQDWFAHKVHTLIDQLQQWQNLLDKELQEEEEAPDGGVLSRRRSVQEEQVRNELAWLPDHMRTLLCS